MVIEVEESCQCEHAGEEKKKEGIIFDFLARLCLGRVMQGSHLTRYSLRAAYKWTRYTDDLHVGELDPCSG